MDNRVGRRVREIRTSLGWSQRKLALRTGLTNSAISHIELGVRMGDPKTWDRIAKALGVDPGYLYAKNEDEYSKYIFKLKSLSKRSLKEADNFLDFLLAKETRRSKGDTELGEEYSVICKIIHGTPQYAKAV